ncbi:MAG: type II toxin-antitoxin system VapC family toxin [Chloroflexi bacterium]|nr:type II toxin-antitoxin system VapC family toxin [Chloroflexota bacterium]
MTGKLLDSTVLIDLSRGNTQAADFVDAARRDQIPLFVSTVSAMELIAGCRDKIEVDKAKELVADFDLAHLSPTASAQAYDLMLTYCKSHGLTIPDALIAATAIVQDLELATDNERHFGMIPNLTVSRPY